MFSQGFFHQCRKHLFNENIFTRKLTLKHNQRSNLWNQIGSTILNDRKPLMINNMTSSKETLCVSWSFGNGLKGKKSKYGTWNYMLPFNGWFSIKKTLKTSLYLFYIPFLENNVISFHMFLHD